MHAKLPANEVAYDIIITLTCIINQFDFNAGTNADALCNSFGKPYVAPATVNNATGETSAPKTLLFELT